MTEQDVRDLHRPWGPGKPWCREDSQQYPCRTIQAIDRQADLDDAIVPRYLLRRIEAANRYPVEDGPIPGQDRNAEAREAFIAGADYEGEHCDDPPGFMKVPDAHGPENDDSPTPDREAGPNSGSG